MEMQPVEQKKNIFQNDRLLVLGMLAIYGLCILGCIGAIFWGLNQEKRTISARETSTAYALATQQVHVTATAEARATNQPHYGYTDYFYGNLGRWPVGKRDNESWNGSVEITDDNVYVWNVQHVKQVFVWPEDIPIGEKSKDFDAAVDIKFMEGTDGNVCSGMLFRKSPEGWRSGVYAFTICNDSHFEAHYYGKGGWEELLGWGHNSAISSSDWNRVEISARKNHSLFTVNDESIFELIDDRQKMGGLSLVVELKEKDPAVIWFDNFEFGSHPEVP
jgi:hypothetical protein